MPRTSNDVPPSWTRNFRASNRRLDQREDARQDLDATRAEVETKLNDAQNLLRDARQAAAEAGRLRAQASDKAHQAELLRQQMARLQEGDLVQAEQRATAAETAYADAQRHNAAAAAAHGLHSGDDCSVCNRPLPQDWQPPVAENFDTARHAQEAAQAVLTEVRSRIRDLATRAEIMDDQATELQQDGDLSWETARTAAARLARLIGRDEIDLATVPPGDELLQSLSGAVIRAREELAAYDSESQQLREQRAAAQSDVTNAHDSLEKIRAAHIRNSEEAAVAMQELRTTLASLPGQLRVDVALPDDPLDIEVIQLGGLDAAYQMLDDRAQELDHRGIRRKQLQQQLDTPCAAHPGSRYALDRTSPCSG